MRAAARRDDADTELAGHLNGLFHGFGRDHEAEGVLAIERADHRRDALDLQSRPRIDQSPPHPFEIMRQRLQPVGIDPAQIGAHQTARDRRRVLLGQTMGDQQPAAEGLGGFGVGIERALNRVGLRRLRDCHDHLLNCHSGRRPRGRTCPSTMPVFLMRPTWYMKSTIFITLTGVVV